MPSCWHPFTGETYRSSSKCFSLKIEGIADETDNGYLWWHGSGRNGVFDRNPTYQQAKKPVISSIRVGRENLKYWFHITNNKDVVIRAQYCIRSIFENRFGEGFKTPNILWLPLCLPSIIRFYLAYIIGEFGYFLKWWRIDLPVSNCLAGINSWRA